MPRERVGSSIALISAMLGVGGSLGLPLAGFVAEHADFHALFWITSVAGVVAFVGHPHDRPRVRRAAAAAASTWSARSCSPPAWSA